MSESTQGRSPRPGPEVSLSDLVRAGRSELPGPERLRDIGAPLGFAGVTPALVGAAAKGAATGLAGSVGMKVGVAVVLVVGATGGVMAVRGTTDAVSRPPMTAGASSIGVAAVTPPARTALPPAVAGPLASAVVAEPPVIPSEPAVPGSSPLPRATPAATAPSVALPSAADAPGPREPASETELELLGQAQQALRSNPAGALAIADHAARQFPGGGLTQEREMIAIEALVHLGRIAEASNRGARFRSAHPGSAYGPRIDALLGADAGLHNP